jgi:NADH-quinone oxidoreductase subunit G
MSDKAKNEVAKDLVTLIIDDKQVAVSKGTSVVDAAKKVGIDIPVFCYHPKMKPVGMCRMCLVEIGRPEIDRTTGEVILEEDGSPKIRFNPDLETGCTVPVSEGMVVRGYTEKVKKARQDVIEFLLTSHPLDCPVCDKGGECPLQNLTMGFGKGTSRFVYDEKRHAAKHVSLGDLIFLDRERCIQCARCTRFQSQVADDPVIGFYNRGRDLEIVTFSDPGFDSYWSGNTTDICPVGALTTADFRFGARPWELNSSASVCNHCPVGCNTTFNIRREAKADGQFVIKRVMPRQNEYVNEIWMCDKGRFAYHFTEDEGRLTQPLVRKQGELTPVSWEEALKVVGEKFKEVGKEFTALAGGRLSNEDLFYIQQVVEELGGKAILNSDMAGGDLVAQIGVGEGTNFSDMGSGTVIMVVACDLEEEAPLYWLRVKQAAERGATLIVANPRATKLDQAANVKIAYEYGDETALVLALLDSVSAKRPDSGETVKKLVRVDAVKKAAKTIAEAENAVVFFGSEGVGWNASESLSQACANLLIATGHTGKPNNGLIAVWDKGNAQGAWDVGLRPSKTLASDLNTKAVYIIGSDPVKDDPAIIQELQASEFVVVQDIFLTETAKIADVVLPAQAYTEREGTFTNAERRVQRFYMALPAPQGTKPDFSITAEIAAFLDMPLEKEIPSLAFNLLAKGVDAYADLDYQKLSKVQEQWPLIGRDDVYYGGTGYDNKQGLGVQISLSDNAQLMFVATSEAVRPADGFLGVPVTRLYDQGNMLQPSKVLWPRLPEPYIVVHPKHAKALGIEPGTTAKLKIEAGTFSVCVETDQSLPEGIVLLPRSMGIPVRDPVPVIIQPE